MFDTGYPILDSMLEPLRNSLHMLYIHVYAPYFAPFIDPMIPALEFLSILFSLLFMAGIFKAVMVMRETASREYEYYKPINIEETEATHRRIEWQIVLDHLHANNPAEWKLGIMEADNLLEETLYANGFPGENLGERLKGMTTRDLVSLNDAWEAHKVRNQIAHEGSAFEMSQREAERVVGLYEKVLHELDFF